MQLEDNKFWSHGERSARLARNYIRTNNNYYLTILISKINQYPNILLYKAGLYKRNLLQIAIYGKDYKLFYLILSMAQNILSYSDYNKLITLPGGFDNSYYIYSLYTMDFIWCDYLISENIPFDNHIIYKIVRNFSSNNIQPDNILIILKYMFSKNISFNIINNKNSYYNYNIEDTIWRFSYIMCVDIREILEIYISNISSKDINKYILYDVSNDTTNNVHNDTPNDTHNDIHNDTPNDSLLIILSNYNEYNIYNINEYYINNIKKIISMYIPIYYVNFYSNDIKYHILNSSIEKFIKRLPNYYALHNISNKKKHKIFGKEHFFRKLCSYL